MSGCGYTAPHFGAAYDDAICIEGYLWDLDSCDEPGGPLRRGGDTPCPECNPELFVQHARDEVEDQGYVAGFDGASTFCGVDGALPRRSVSVERRALALILRSSGLMVSVSWILSW